MSYLLFTFDIYFWTISIFVTKLSLKKIKFNRNVRCFYLTIEKKNRRHKLILILPIFWALTCLHSSS